MRLSLGALLVAVAIAASACEAPSGTSSIEVELHKFGIDTSQPSCDAGRLRLTVVNTGEDPHTLVVAGETGEVIIATDLIAPGTSVELELECSATRLRASQTENDDGSVRVWPLRLYPA